MSHTGRTSLPRDASASELALETVLAQGPLAARPSQAGGGIEMCAGVESGIALVEGHGHAATV